MADAGSVYGIASGLQSKTPTGMASAALSAGSLAARNGAFGSNTGTAAGSLGAASGALQLYSGLKQGGVVGYGNAAVGSLHAASGAASLAGDSQLAGQLGSAAGYAAIPLSLYNFAKNYQSGATGTDALNGAEAGASIGTAVVPGIGTAVGAVIGGAVGALSSALGGGKADPETTGFNSLVAANAQTGNNGIISQLNPSQAYQSLAGMMDAKNNTAGHSTPLEMVFGRAGEGNLMTQMTSQINSAIKSGQIGANATPSQIYNSVVMPWLQSKNAYVPANAIISSNGTKNNGTVDSLLTQLIGQWQTGQLNANSQVGVSGQTIAGLPTYADGQAGTSNVASLESSNTGRAAIALPRGAARTAYV